MSCCLQDPRGSHQARLFFNRSGSNIQILGHYFPQEHWTNLSFLCHNILLQPALDSVSCCLQDPQRKSPGQTFFEPTLGFLTLLQSLDILLFSCRISLRITGYIFLIPQYPSSPSLDYILSFATILRGSHQARLFEPTLGFLTLLQSLGISVMSFLQDITGQDSTF